MIYELVNLGARFSTKACMPSFWSLVEKVAWKMRFSKLSPSAREVSKAVKKHFKVSKQDVKTLIINLAQSAQTDKD